MFTDLFRLTILTASLVAGIPVLEKNAACASGVHIIVARASSEQPGEGIIGQVAAQVMYQIPGSDIVAVDYPASLYDYPQSESAGVTAMTNLITQYVSSCPSSKIVLMGYSQGAQVVSDTLIGASSGFGGGFGNGGLATSYTHNIVAVVQMGDPSHVPNLSFDAGTSVNHGLFPRSNSVDFESKGWANKIQSYCDTGDEFCDSGYSLPVHLGYVQKYGAQAASFVVSKVNAAK